MVSCSPPHHHLAHLTGRPSPSHSAVLRAGWVKGRVLGGPGYGVAGVKAVWAKSEIQGEAQSGFPQPGSLCSPFRIPGAACGQFSVCSHPRL